MTGVPPNVATVAPERFAPVIVTVVPPRVDPELGATDAIVGIGATNVNPAVDVAEPPDVVTTTSTAPAACAGVVAVTCVAEPTVNEVAAVPPKVTDVVLLRFVPVIVTAVPPAVGPDDGTIVDTVGGGGGVPIVKEGREIAKSVV